MSLVEVAVFLGLALLWRTAAGGRARGWFLLGLSVLAIFWLQPATALRGMDTWLPLAALGLAVLSWVATVDPAGRCWRDQLPALALVLGLTLGLGLLRFVPLPDWLGAHRPPPLGQIAAGIGLLALVVLLAARLPGRVARAGALTLLLVLFVLLKYPPLTAWVSGGLRLLTEQPVHLASALDLRWLGFSYLAFRLIHTIRDRQAGRLHTFSLQEYLVYLFFFPAYTAGPIDRLERFVSDLRAPLGSLKGDLEKALPRLLSGLARKFVLADALALVALSPTLAAQIQAPGWLWLGLVAYSFQIYLDFSGYTDLAIGLGLLAGIRLPENFNRPYSKPNLIQFWNNWHITLTQWFRAYFFNPLTRWLKRRLPRLPQALVVFSLQTATMILIGLWHGIALNFVLWGLWHAFGLFINNRWNEQVKPRLPDLSARAGLNRAVTVFSTLLTFIYVSLGWLWFLLPDAGQAGRVLLGLFGWGG